MALNKEFNKFSWVYPKKNPSNFIGAVEEYPLSAGGKLAVVFNDKGAYVMYDEDGNFTTSDYAGRGGILHNGDDLEEYDNIKVLARVFVASTGDVISGVDVYDDVIAGFSFADVDAARADIIERLKVTGTYGFYTIVTMGNVNT